MPYSIQVWKFEFKNLAESVIEYCQNSDAVNLVNALTSFENEDDEDDNVKNKRINKYDVLLNRFRRFTSIYAKSHLYYHIFCS